MLERGTWQLYRSELQCSRHARLGMSVVHLLFLFFYFILFTFFFWICLANAFYSLFLSLSKGQCSEISGSYERVDVGRSRVLQLIRSMDAISNHLSLFSLRPSYFSNILFSFLIFY